LKKAAYNAENELIQRTVTPYANGVAQAAAQQEFVSGSGELGAGVQFEAAMIRRIRRAAAERL
jgi:hypothetical protein